MIECNATTTTAKHLWKQYFGQYCRGEALWYIILEQNRKHRWEIIFNETSNDLGKRPKRFKKALTNVDLGQKQSLWYWASAIFLENYTQVRSKGRLWYVSICWLESIRRAIDGILWQGWNQRCLAEGPHLRRVSGVGCGQSFAVFSKHFLFALISIQRFLGHALSMYVQNPKQCTVKSVNMQFFSLDIS